MVKIIEIEDVYKNLIFLNVFHIIRIEVNSEAIVGNSTVYYTGGHLQTYLPADVIADLINK